MHMKTTPKRVSQHRIDQGRADNHTVCTGGNAGGLLAVAQEEQCVVLRLQRARLGGCRDTSPVCRADPGPKTHQGASELARSALLSYKMPPRTDAVR